MDLKYQEIILKAPFDDRFNYFHVVGKITKIDTYCFLLVKFGLRRYITYVFFDKKNSRFDYQDLQAATIYTIDTLPVDSVKIIKTAKNIYFMSIKFSGYFSDINVSYEFSIKDGELLYCKEIPGSMEEFKIKQKRSTKQKIMDSLYSYVLTGNVDIQIFWHVPKKRASLFDNYDSIVWKSDLIFDFQ